MVAGILRSRTNEQEKIRPMALPVQVLNKKPAGPPDSILNSQFVHTHCTKTLITESSKAYQYTADWSH